MSCVFVLTPVVVGVAWPVFCAVATAALAQAGYTAAVAKEEAQTQTQGNESVEVEMERTQALAESLRRDECLTVSRGDVAITLRKDARGRCVLHVEGSGKTKEELRAIGEEMTNRITQRFVHEKLRRELADKGFSVAEEETLPDRTIRLTVRRWR